MLKFLSGRKQSRKALLIIILGALALSVIGLFSVVSGGGSAGLLRGTGGSDTVIARVGSFDVTLSELNDALKTFGQQIAQGQGRNRGEDIKTLFGLYGKQVLDNLIRQKVILYEADRLNLTASDGEVQSRLRQVFNPWPGAEQYRMRLQQAGITPIRFEDDLRSSIAQEHLRSYVTAAVYVDLKEVQEEYRRANTSYTVQWVEADPEKLRNKVEVNDAALQAYFDSHKSDFSITSEQRKAKYIFVDQNKAGEAIQISDDELKQEFTPERFIKSVRVSEIILNTHKEAASRDAAAEDSSTAEEEKHRKKTKSKGQT